MECEFCSRCSQTIANNGLCNECIIEIDKYQSLYYHLKISLLKQLRDDDLDNLRYMYSNHTNHTLDDKKDWNKNLLHGWENGFDELFDVDNYEIADGILKEWFQKTFSVNSQAWHEYDMSTDKEE